MRDLPFKFEFEIEAFEKAGPDSSKERRIGGIVSTDHLDRQHEVLLQDGLDFKPFLKGGWFNDNHNSDTSAAVGFPDKAELITLRDGKKGWYVEGYLLKGHKPADDLWSLATALQKTDRKLGFSVEGAILERDEDNRGIVKKAIVREVAITRCPVNDHTALHVLAKSLSAGAAVPVPTTPVTGDGAGRVVARRHVEAASQGSVAPRIREKLAKRGKKKMNEVEQKVLDKALANERLSRGETALLLTILSPDLSFQQAEGIADYHFKRRAA